MGLFSIYTGIVYNDVFSKSINLFGSSWFINESNSTIVESKSITLDPATKDYSQKPYPLGLDPVWQVTQVLNDIYTYKTRRGRGGAGGIRIFGIRFLTVFFIFFFLTVIAPGNVTFYYLSYSASVCEGRYLFFFFFPHSLYRRDIPLS